MGQDFNDRGKRAAKSALPQKKPAILVYEEQASMSNEGREPTKFKGFRDFKSKDDKTGKPKYALMIFDVSAAAMAQNSTI